MGILVGLIWIASASPANGTSKTDVTTPLFLTASEKDGFNRVIVEETWGNLTHVKPDYLLSNAQGQRIEDVFIPGLQTSNDVVFADMQIPRIFVTRALMPRSKLTFTNVSAAEGFYLGVVLARNVSIQGGTFSERGGLRGVHSHHDINIRNTTWLKNLGLSEVSVGSDRKIWIEDVAVMGNLSLEHVRTNGYGSISLQNTSVEGDMSLSDVQTNTIDLRGITWGGTLRLSLDPERVGRILVNPDQADRIHYAAPRIPLVY